MKFSIGDPVYIKSSNEEGVILEFIGEDMASVRVDKKSFHVYFDDMEHPYLRWFTQKKVVKNNVKSIDQLLTEKKSTRKSTLPQGIYLVFMPTYSFDGFEDSVEKIKVYLYNETLGNYKMEYACKCKNETIFTIDSTLTPESEFYLHDIDFETASQNPSFYHRFIDQLDPKLDYDAEFILKPKKLFDKIHEVKYQNKAFFSFLLIETIVPREAKEVIKTFFPSSQNEKKLINHFDFENALKKLKYEVDLHIDKLYPNYKGLGASEMLQIQLRECQKALDLAIATHQEALVFIHGIGKGSLKNEIHLILDQTKWVKRYVNRYDNRYGYGATEVFFQY